MPLFELTHESLTAVPRATLHQQAFRERDDIQRLLKSSITVLGDDLLLIAEEFSQWADSRRRIDLLAIDKSGALVVIELKRTEDGGHMELQAIRYAAMISTLTFTQSVAALADFESIDKPDAEESILKFLGVTSVPEDFGKIVRIVLVSPDFSKELTTAVLWLNDGGLDIRCIRLRPYKLDDRTLLEVEQIIPLREAQDYTVRVKEKEFEARIASESTIDFTRYDLTIGNETFHKLWKRNLIRQVIAAAAKSGLTIEKLIALFTRRKLIIVHGHLRGDMFLEAAQTEREKTGYVFRPSRFFMDDDQLIEIGDQTVALSTQLGRNSLPLIDEVIKAVPDARISYRETSTP